MRTKQRGCVFCGGTPLTKEHIWSDWLDSILPRANSSRSEARQTTIAEKVVGGQPIYLPTSKSERVRQGAVHSTTSRTVCKECNNGWMKDIVDRAKPVATEVIKLRQTVLSPDSQTCLATWLVLSAVMRDQKATAHPQKVQPAMRQLLMSEGLPPTDVFVAIGAFEGPRSVADSYNARVVRSTMPPYPVTSSLHSVAVAMGGLFAVILVPWSVDASLLKQFPALYGDSLTQVWPRRDICIPAPNYARNVVWGPFVEGVPGTADEIANRARNAFTKSYRGHAWQLPTQ
jgi:hypothetical protein